MKSIIQEASSIAKAIEQGLEKAGNPRDFSIKILEYPEKNFFRLTTRSAKIALYWDEKGGAKRQVEPFVGQESVSSTRDEYRQDTGRRQDRERGRERRDDRRDDRREDRREDREMREVRSEQSRQPRGERRPVRTVRSQSGESAEQQAAPSHQSHVRESRSSERSYDRSSDESNRSKTSFQNEEPQEPRWNQEMSAFAREWITTVFRELDRSDISVAISSEGYLLRILLDQPFTADTDRERKLFASLALLLVESLKRKFRVNLRGHKVVITHKLSSQAS